MLSSSSSSSSLSILQVACPENACIQQERAAGRRQSSAIDPEVADRGRSLWKQQYRVGLGFSSLAFHLAFLLKSKFVHLNTPSSSIDLFLSWGSRTAAFNAGGYPPPTCEGWLAEFFFSVAIFQIISISFHCYGHWQDGGVGISSHWYMTKLKNYTYLFNNTSQLPDLCAYCIYPCGKIYNCPFGQCNSFPLPSQKYVQKKGNFF